MPPLVGQEQAEAAQQPIGKQLLHQPLEFQQRFFEFVVSLLLLHCPI